MTVHKKIAYVLRLTDRFGTIDIPHALVTTQHGVIALNKRNGYYVLMEPQPAEVNLQIQAPGYESINIQLAARNGYSVSGPQVITMLPLIHIQTSFSNVTGVLCNASGKPLTNQAFRYALYPVTGVTLLQPVAEGDSEISILIPHWLILEGQDIVFDGKSEIYHVVSNDRQRDVYKLDRPLMEKGFPMGCPVICLYPSMTDAEGQYTVYRHQIHSSEITFYTENGRRMQ